MKLFVRSRVQALAFFTCFLFVWFCSVRFGKQSFIFFALFGLGNVPLYYVSKGTGSVGSEKWQFSLTFSNIYADVEWVGESEKVQKCADVI